MTDLVVEKHCVYLDEHDDVVHIERYRDGKQWIHPWVGSVREDGRLVRIGQYEMNGKSAHHANLIKKLDCPPIDFSVFGQMDEDGYMAVFTVGEDKQLGAINLDGAYPARLYADEWNPATEDKEEDIDDTERNQIFKGGEKHGTNVLIAEIIALLESKREK